MIFRPHVTVACLVSAGEKFLVVEETVNGKTTWNQPAGHLEAGETLLAAAERELYEETGIRAAPDALLKIHQWVAPDGTPFIRFLFRVLQRVNVRHTRRTTISTAATGSVRMRLFTVRSCAPRW